MTTGEAKLLTGDQLHQRIQLIERSMKALLEGCNKMLTRIVKLELRFEEEDDDDIDDPEAHPFDNKIRLWRNRMTDELQHACINVNDSMEMAWASARQVFGEEAKPEHAFEIFNRIAAAQDEYEKEGPSVYEFEPDEDLDEGDIGEEETEENGHEQSGND